MLGRPRLHGLWLIWLGVVRLIAVALTHVAEVFHIFPTMGWGLPDNPGHYLDLVSAVFGLPLLVAGLVARAITRSRRQSRPGSFTARPPGFSISLLIFGFACRSRRKLSG